MSKTPFEKIVQWALDKAVADLQMTHDFVTSESPIEALLITAVHAEGKHGANCFYEGVHIYGPMPKEKIATLDGLSEFALYCVPQAQDGAFRIDFVFFVRCADKLHFLAVECDGHDFHERTKDQAARDRSRDRALQERGYTVFRFTGREIYADPMKCAGQIATWANRKIYGADE